MIRGIRVHEKTKKGHDDMTAGRHDNDQIPDKPTSRHVVMSNEAAHSAAATDPLLMSLVCRDDDHRAFSELVRRYEKKLLNFFARSGVQYDAEDLTQQTFLRLYRYRDRYSPSGAKVSTFLFILARQVWIDELRKRKRRERLAEEFAQEVGDLVAPPAADMVAGGGAVDLNDALAKLPPGMRRVVELGVYQDLPYAEIAEILEIPEGTVKSRMFNALALLRGMLRE